MVFLRALFLVLLLTAIGFFVCFLVTGQPRFKHYGLRVLRWTVVAAAIFFGVLVVENLR
ncbi:MAG: hypothetical protein V4627_08785 [Pseudomonadota bacterium]